MQASDHQSQDSRATTLLNLLPSSEQQQPTLAEPRSYNPQYHSASSTAGPISLPTEVDANRPTSISVDALFRNIGQQGSAPQQQQQQQQQSQPFRQADSPAPSEHHMEQDSDNDYNAPRNPLSTSSEKQTALLSLLGNVSSPGSDVQPLDLDSTVRPRVAPNTISPNESQGKMLLEQLMANSGSESRSPVNVPPAAGEPYRSPSPASYTSLPRTTSPPVRHSSPLNPQQEAASQSVDNGRSMFGTFVSPFDAFSSVPPPSTTRKKPVPPVNPQAQSQPAPSGSPARSISPRGAQDNPQQFPRRYVSPEDPFVNVNANQSDGEVQPSGDRPINPATRTSPHHGVATSPPPYPALVSHPTISRDSPGGVESPAPPSVTQAPIPGVKEMESSGSSSGRENKGVKREDVWPKAALPTTSAAPKPSRVPAPPPGAPTFSLDMTAPSHSSPIAAPPNLTAVTPIALLKLENIYSQGTTIAVSGFIAYAMTRGRVRLIARSNGSRALLHLPNTFPPATSATDMVVSGNLLACVTSDGGLVIWEVPAELDENPPVVLLINISPTDGAFGLKLVKWHPKQPGSIAVASDREVYVFNVNEARRVLQGEETPLSELAKISTVINVPSPLVSFTFDSAQIALATISIDSTITLWSIKERLPFWSGRVPGEGLPSSIDFLDGGILVGRKQGTVLQFLPVMSAQVAATVKLTMGQKVVREDDESIFCHVGYDPRIRTLWVAHSSRASLFAIRLSFESSVDSDQSRSSPISTPTVEQIIEFPTPMQCINMAILVSDDFDNLTAVASFAMHQGGVDQINIPMDTFESTLAAATTKLPPPTYAPEKELPKSTASTVATPKKSMASTVPAGQRVAQSTNYPLPDPNGPPSDGEAPDVNTSKNKGGRIGKSKEKSAKPDVKTASAEPKAEFKDAESVILPKDLRKVEDSLHSRIGKLLSKELDKQHQRIEELRRADQEADFNRQETILKLISTELTKNTTRVVEQAIKSEVQNTVLPALEQITKNEIRAALSNQVAKGLADSMKQALPNELERVLLRPDVSSHVARTFSTAVTPLIERLVKDAISKTLIPAYQQTSNTMHMELTREISTEILNLKKEITAWQGEALRGTETVIRDMDQTVRTLSEQVRTLTLQVNSQSQGVTHRSSPGVAAAAAAHAQAQHQASQHLQHPLPHPHMSNSSHLRHGGLATLTAPNPLPTLLGPAVSQSQTQPPASNSFASGMWQPNPPAQSQYAPPPNPPASQSYKALPQQPIQTQPLQPQASALRQSELPPPSQVTRPIVGEDWDETFLSTLGKQDPRLLRELLQRCNPEVVMPSKRENTPLSQAVILTLIHRLSESLLELSPQDEAFKVALWWLQRAAYTLNPNDRLITSYVGPVLNTSQTILNQTLARLPVGSASNELENMINQIQRSLAVNPA